MGYVSDKCASYPTLSSGSSIQSLHHWNTEYFIFTFTPKYTSHHLHYRLHWMLNVHCCPVSLISLLFSCLVESFFSPAVLSLLSDLGSNKERRDLKFHRLKNKLCFLLISCSRSVLFFLHQASSRVAWIKPQTDTDTENNNTAANNSKTVTFSFLISNI